MHSLLTLVTSNCTYYIVIILIFGPCRVIDPVGLGSLIYLLFAAGHTDYLGGKLCKRYNVPCYLLTR